MWHAWKTGGVLARFSMEGPDGKRPLGRPMRKWEDDIKIILKKWDRKAWTGLIWLWIGTSGRRLCMWK